MEKWFLFDLPNNRNRNIKKIKSKAEEKIVQLLFDCYNWMDLIDNRNAICMYSSDAIII